MRTTNKFIALLLCLIMLAAAFPVVSLASGAEDLTPCISPVFSADDIGALPPADDVRLQMEEELPDWIDEVVTTVRKAMTLRETTVEIELPPIPFINNDYVNKIYNYYLPYIIREAVRHTGEPDEGDYILRHMDILQYSARHKNNTFILQFNFIRHSDAAQEQTVAAEAEKLLQSLDLEGKTDYQKVKTIYDWMCSNITYYDENLENDENALKYTAYAALVDRTAVGQGFASLLYRLLLTEGIDCRIIPGIGKDSKHAWNIVKLDGKYYNVDSAWDSVNRQTNRDYMYFLLDEENFTDHIRSKGDEVGSIDEDYTSAEFNATYPMSETNYDVPNDDPVEPGPSEPDPVEPVVKVTGVTVEPAELTLAVGETRALNAVVQPEDATDKSLTWSTSNDSVVTVSGGTVTAVGPGTANVVVATNDGGLTDSCAVTVKASEPPAEGCTIAAAARSHEDGGILVSAYVSANSDCEGRTMVIAAAYRGNVLVDVTTREIDLRPGETLTEELPLAKAADDCEIKVFVWGSLLDANSLGKAATCKVTAQTADVTLSAV